MIGDKLASGAASATFTGPRLRFDPVIMQRDLSDLPALEFMDKYMVTLREYELMIHTSGEATNILLKQMADQTEAIERLVQQDQKEDEGLRRDCFIEPFVAFGLSGRVIVSRDQPVLPKEVSKLALPRHLRKERERLPTTGHVVRSCVYDPTGSKTNSLNGKRVLFGPMSGTAICFKNYPTWIALDVNEIIGIVCREDAEIVEEELEPLS